MAKTTSNKESGNTLTETAGNLGEQAARTADAQASTMMDRAGDTLGQIARAIRDAGQGMRDERPEIADVANTAAERVEEAGQYLHEHTASEVLSAAQDVARRQPALVVGGGLVLGLAIGRLLRSTQDAGRGSRSWESGAYGRGSEYETGAGYAAGTGYGAGTAGSGYGTGYGTGESGYGAYAGAGASAAALAGSGRDAFGDAGYATGATREAGSELAGTTAGMSGPRDLDDDIRGSAVDPVAGADIDRTDDDPAMRGVDTGDEALDDLGTRGSVTPGSALDDETSRS